MKHILYCLLLLSCSAAVAQQINPPVIFQRDTIILQNTDAYYTPFAPPVSTDTREQLCNIAKELRDSDGVTDYYTYDPITNGSHLTTLYGDTAIWMRLFQAARKPDGTPTCIIAGSNVTNDTAHTNGHGPVIISKNEDVDFRASGSIHLMSGFHVMPGAHFHAYIEPRYDSVIFIEEFASPSLSQWAPLDSVNDNGSTFRLSNLHPNTATYGAGDGKALKITLQMDTSIGGDYNFPLITSSDICHGSIPACVAFTKLDFSHSCGLVGSKSNPLTTGQMWSCPWPFKSADTPWVPVSQNLPYGKYEIRDSLPRGMYHSNTYAADNWADWNLGEMEYSDSTKILPGLAHRVCYGPFKGKFGTRLSTQIAFRSGSAHFSLSNNPIRILIDNFPYAVGGIFYDGATHNDTVITFDNNTFYKGGIPLALLAADSVLFYYERSDDNTSDDVPWSIDSTGRYFTGTLPVAPGRDSIFTKGYQPSRIIPLGDTTPPYDSGFPCHWDHVSGKVYLDVPYPASWSHALNRSFKYTRPEGAAYPQPKVQVATNQWHTWTMELFPHECRFLVDGRVVQRVPDRLIPRSDPRNDFVSNFPRMLTPFIIAMEHNGNTQADFNNRSLTQISRVVDYVKIWDLPKDYSVSVFPY